MNEKYRNLINSLQKNTNQPNGWVRCLVDLKTDQFYLMGYGGMGTSIIMPVSDYERNVLLRDMIKENKLIKGETEYYWEEQKELTMYHHVEEDK